MSVCAFFGHHDCPAEVKTRLREVLVDLVENRSVDTFYVGNQGSFDRIVRTVLREMKMTYPYIQYTVVLAYLPQNREVEQEQDHSDTMLPEGIEKTPKRFAISWRNKWMLQQADVVVTYIRHSWGGAAQFTELAKRQKKTIINL